MAYLGSCIERVYCEGILLVSLSVLSSVSHRLYFGAYLMCMCVWRCAGETCEWQHRPCLRIEARIDCRMIGVLRDTRPRISQYALIRDSHAHTDVTLAFDCIRAGVWGRYTSDTESHTTFQYAGENTPIR